MPMESPKQNVAKSEPPERRSISTAKRLSGNGLSRNIPTTVLGRCSLCRDGSVHYLVPGSGHRGIPLCKLVAIHHSFRATSGPVIRSISGNVAAMIVSDAASPPTTVDQ